LLEESLPESAVDADEDEEELDVDELLE